MLVGCKGDDLARQICQKSVEELIAHFQAVGHAGGKCAVSVSP